jgi:3-oxoacyl-[acyl-carrier protein] reductase
LSTSIGSLLRLDGRVALVTGSTRGIGRAIAARLAEAGAHVAVCGRDLDRAKATADELSGAHGIACMGLAMDVGIVASVEAAHRAVFRAHARLDVLVNNAGILGDALLGMVSETMIDEVLGTNLKGVILNLQAAAKLMRRARAGAIVNIASIMGTHGNKGQVVYSGSKAGVIGVTLSAAKELAPDGIRVNAVVPGVIATDMVSQLPPQILHERASSVAMGRPGDPDDVARAVLFLASDLAAYVTGQCLGVDGGMVI